VEEEGTVTIARNLVIWLVTAATSLKAEAVDSAAAPTTARVTSVSKRDTLPGIARTSRARKSRGFLVIDLWVWSYLRVWYMWIYPRCRGRSLGVGLRYPCFLVV